MVFSYPLEGAKMAGLTSAESAVASLLLDGLSNGEIARVRGTTVGTVGKQVESIYRKLRVSGRRQFAALMATRPPPTR
jgi:DNA-binding CsgD family transcriptional regulator